MTRLFTDQDGPGSMPEILEYVEAVLRDNFEPNEGRKSWGRPYERSARAITLSVLHRLGIEPQEGN
jgi:hypothetical protein